MYQCFLLILFLCVFCVFKLWLLSYLKPLIFYPNVTTLTYVRVFGIANPSVCLSSVRNVRAPTQGVEAFGNISSLLCSLPWPFSDLRVKFYGDRPEGTYPSKALNAKGVAK